MQGTYGNGRLVTVFGGSGFLGRQVVRALAMRGYRVRVGVRRPHLAGHLRPLGMVGQIQPVQANVRYPESVSAALVGAEAAVNLVGIVLERGKQSFEAVNSEGAATVASAAAAAGVKHFVQVSALGSDSDSESAYFRSKAAGEARTFDHFPNATILRPAIQFGLGDAYFSRYAAIARMSPVVPIIGAETKFQFVYVGDVAAAAQAAVDGHAPTGEILELGGPEILTGREAIDRMLRVIQRRRLRIPVPDALALAAGSVLQFLPGRLLTADQVRQLAIDTVISKEAVAEHRTLKDVGVMPTALGAILPTYLSRFRVKGQFTNPTNA